jgi:hypothetical protein
MSYAFDPTGKAVQNQIIGESKPIVLAPGRSYLYIIPVSGPYFAQSLVIKYTPSVGAERFLTEGVDYMPSFQYVDATRKISAPVYAGISFMDLTLDGTLTYNYQALGSIYMTDPAVITSIETTSLVDPLFTSWDSLVTLPAVPVVDYPWTTVNVDDVHRTVEELAKVGLVAHLRPKFLSAPGPEVFIPTPEEIGLGEVPNYPPATLQQAIDGVDDASLMTPLTTAAAVESEVIKQLANIGYLVPVDYAGSIYIENERFTVNVDGEVYVIKASSLPYTTSGVWANDAEHFDMFQYAQKEKWNKTYITVAGTEPVITGLGSVFDVVVEHDSRVIPQLLLNDVLFLVYTVDYKLSDDKLYVNYPLASGDRLLLLTKRSLMSVGRDQTVNKVFQIVDNTNVFDLGDIHADPDNLRVTLNDFITLNAQQGDYSITNGVMTVAYRLAVGDVLEVENIDSTFIFGKTALRSILLD